jgi:hypothetical protein
MKTAPIAALLMTISGLFILFVSALCIINAPSPASFSLPISLISLCSASAIGGFFDMKRVTGAKGYIAAMLSVMIFVLFLLLCRNFIPESGDPTTPSPAIATFTAILLSALLGAFLGSHETNVKRRRKRKR